MEYHGAVLSLNTPERCFLMQKPIRKGAGISLTLATGARLMVRAGKMLLDTLTMRVSLIVRWISGMGEFLFLPAAGYRQGKNFIMTTARNIGMNLSNHTAAAAAYVVKDEWGYPQEFYKYTCVLQDTRVLFRKEHRSEPTHL